MSRRSEPRRHRSLLEAERPLVPAKHAGSFRIALCYPNGYFVGMSNLGFHVVYRLLNAVPEVWCERAFLPDPTEAALPVSFESQTELRRFDAVAFSISFESDYPHVLEMLHRAGIPLRSTARGPNDPIVVLGGAATFLNPEPLAPFADVIALGEGEVLVERLMEALLGATDPRRGLAHLREPDGFYLPARYAVHYHADGTIAAYEGPGPVRRQWATTERLGVPRSAFLARQTEMANRLLVEISRGCACFCRFCWAGYHYLPIRAVPRREIADRARNARPFTNRVGLVSTAICDHPEIEGIVDDLAGLGFQVSVASLRLDDLSAGLLKRLAATGLQGLALAPESGSEHLRHTLNKRPENAEILDRATLIFEQGILNLKLYYMVGLPWEEPSDIEAIVTLTEAIRKRMLAVARSKGRIGRLQPSINPFLPKPGTPFQWLKMADPREIDRKARWLRDALGRMPNTRAVCKSARSAVTQAVLALGDRRLADVLEFGCLRQVDFKTAIEAVGLDLEHYAFRERAPNEILPWDIVAGGVNKAFLQTELERARTGAFTPRCTAAPGCTRCGACDETRADGSSARIT